MVDEVGEVEEDVVVGVEEEDVLLIVVICHLLKT